MSDSGQPIVPDEVLPAGELADTSQQTPSPYARDGWKQKFIDTLGLMPNVRSACEIAGVSRGHAYNVRAADRSFAAAWDAAIEDAVDRLEQAAWKRCTVGIERVTYFNDGKTIKTKEVIYSDRLTELLLKRWRPRDYRERVDINLTDTSEVDAEIVRLAKELGIRAEALPQSQDEFQQLEQQAEGRESDTNGDSTV